MKLEMRIDLFVAVMLLTCCGQPETKVETIWYDDGLNIKEIVTRSEGGLKCHECFTAEGELEKWYCTMEDLLHGEVKFYYKNGKLKQVQRYRYGFENGKMETFYPDGQLKEESLFGEGVQHGDHKYYLPNGKLRAFHSFEKGQAIFKVLYTYDTVDSLVSTEIKLAPKVFFRDTVVQNEQFEVKVALPRGSIDYLDFNNLVMMYDAVMEKDSNNYQEIGYPNPRFAVSFEGKSAKETIQLEAAGKYTIYGYVGFNSNSQRDSILGSFKKEVEVLSPYTAGQ